MRSIQMVDLKQQYQKLKSEIDAAVVKVLESSAFINGPQVQSFAAALAAYHQVKHVIPCANGTDALQISMMALGLHPGDEVISPSFTFIATAEVIALLNLTPIFVDVDPKTFCIEPEAIEKAITKKTKAALVFLVIAFSMASGSMQNVFGSTSTNIGVRFNKAITSAVAIKVKEGEITSSPGCKPKAIMEICRASVPLAQGITCFT